MVQNIQLTKNFNLYELIASQQAVRNSFAEQFEPDQSVIDNLKELAVNILQPLRNELGKPITISSGYRCLRLNTVIKGSKNSQHLKGKAADIENFQLGNEKLFQMIIDMDLPFDQLINEYNFSWVHVSYDQKKSRKQVLNIK